MHANDITLKQLRALAAIVRAGNLSAAANVLNVTPPAVSTQLKLLEANAGGTLLSRGPAGQVALTPEGQEFLTAIARIERALQTCVEKVTALRAGHAGHVSVGVVSTGKYFAPGLIKHAREAMAGVEFALKIGNRGQILEALEDESIDMAIMGRPPRAPVSQALALGNHPYVLIAPPGHRLAGRERATYRDLDGELFLGREPGSGTRILTDRFIARIGEDVGVQTMELGSNETIKQGVIAGLGIAIISAHTVAAELAGGRLVTLKLPGLPIMRQWYLIRPANARPGVAATAFETFLKDLGGSYLPAIPLEYL